MFESLSERLGGVFDKLRGRGALSESDVRAAMREVRVALELHCRGDRPDAAGALVSAIEARVAALPPAQTGFRVVTATFLRARAEQRAANTRAILLEYRFRVLAN